ncbi:UNVERIFIED_CONTAM: hypothetical protein GTU68_055400 [Idotea baltica]|nr:hypothetical protein [Idotea baltica]
MIRPLKPGRGIYQRNCAAWCVGMNPSTKAMQSWPGTLGFWCANV